MFAEVAQQHRLEVPVLGFGGLRVLSGDPLGMAVARVYGSGTLLCPGHGKVRFWLPSCRVLGCLLGRC
jgi:hypothetical protein